MPVTRKRSYLGTMPKGVSSPCGLVTRTTEPTVAPSSSDISFPRIMGGMAAMRFSKPCRSVGDWVADVRTPLSGFCAGSSSASAEPLVTVFRRSLTFFSSSGIIPFNTAARAWSPGDQDLLVNRGSRSHDVRLFREAIHQLTPLLNSVALNAQQIDVGS